MTTNTTSELYRCTATNTWTLHNPAAASGGLPAGAIVFVDTGACPTGYTEQIGLNGKTILGTLNANADVGGTGGADSITPAGTNSGAAVDAHSGTAVTDHASHTHTYTQVPNHVHGVSTILRTATTGGATTQVTVAADTSSTADTTRKTDNPDGGVATGTTAGPSATLTHSVTQPANHVVTQPTFAGTAFAQRLRAADCM